MADNANDATAWRLLLKGLVLFFTFLSLAWVFSLGKTPWYGLGLASLVMTALTGCFLYGASRAAAK